MPEGTKVDKMYQALRREGADKGKAARIAQSKTGQSLATGKPTSTPEHKAPKAKMARRKTR
jgi:hypothetical protein